MTWTCDQQLIVSYHIVSYPVSLSGESVKLLAWSIITCIPFHVFFFYNYWLLVQALLDSCILLLLYSFITNLVLLPHFRFHIKKIQRRLGLHMPFFIRKQPCLYIDLRHFSYHIIAYGIQGNNYRFVNIFSNFKHKSLHINIQDHICISL